MPYRDAESSLQDRCLALETEIAEIHRRTDELPHLEAQKKNLRRELATLTRRKAPSRRSEKIFSVVILMIAAVVVSLVALRSLGPKVKTAGYPNVSHLE